MHPLFALIVRAAIIFTILFLIIQPYNWYCHISQKCQGFRATSLLPKLEGKDPIDVFFEVTNNDDDIIFESNYSVIQTVFNRVNTVSFTAENLSNRIIFFKPRLVISPQEYEKHINLIECLCFNEYKVKPGEKITMEMKFSIDTSIVKAGLVPEIIAKQGRYDRDRRVPSFKIRYILGRKRV
jgi:cytochrome c oxidase assembly protein Cox11